MDNTGKIKGMFTPNMVPLDAQGRISEEDKSKPAGMKTSILRILEDMSLKEGRSLFSSF